MAFDSTIRRWRAYTVTAAAALTAAAVVWALLEVYDLSLWTTLAIAYAGIIGGLVAYGYFLPDPDVQVVDVDGPIRSDGGPGAIEADDVVDAIEGTDAAALCIRLDTPGGEIVPSERIRRAVAEFDGPTVGVARGTCASGGYLIASACDQLFAHESSMIGSIGVIGSRLNLHDFAEKHGVSYERFAAGEYKDAGHQFKEPDDDERAYIQDLIEGHYATFVERVADGRNLAPSTVRDTEARLYRAREAMTLGLVDTLGTTADATDALVERLDVDEDHPEPVVDETNPSSSTMLPMAAAQKVAYAFGAGIGDRLAELRETSEITIEYR